MLATPANHAALAAVAQKLALRPLTMIAGNKGGSYKPPKAKDPGFNYKPKGGKDPGFNYNPKPPKGGFKPV